MNRCAMATHHLLIRIMPLILALGLLPALASCHHAAAGGNGRSAAPAFSAMAAIGAHPGVPRDRLARAVDALFTDPAVGETRAVLVMREAEAGRM